MYRQLQCNITADADVGGGGSTTRPASSGESLRDRGDDISLRDRGDDIESSCCTFATESLDHRPQRPDSRDQKTMDILIRELLQAQIVSSNEAASLAAALARMQAHAQAQAHLLVQLQLQAQLQAQIQVQLQTQMEAQARVQAQLHMLLNLQSQAHAQAQAAQAVFGYAQAVAVPAGLGTIPYSPPQVYSHQYISSHVVEPGSRLADLSAVEKVVGLGGRDATTACDARWEWEGHGDRGAGDGGEGVGKVFNGGSSEDRCQISSATAGVNDFVGIGAFFRDGNSLGDCLGDERSHNYGDGDIDCECKCGCKSGTALSKDDSSIVTMSSTISLCPASSTTPSCSPGDSGWGSCGSCSSRGSRNSYSSVPIHRISTGGVGSSLSPVLSLMRSKLAPKCDGVGVGVGVGVGGSEGGDRGGGESTVGIAYLESPAPPHVTDDTMTVSHYAAKVVPVAVEGELCELKNDKGGGEGEGEGASGLLEADNQFSASRARDGTENISIHRDGSPGRGAMAAPPQAFQQPQPQLSASCQQPLSALTVPPLPQPPVAPGLSAGPGAQAQVKVLAQTLVQVQTKTEARNIAFIRGNGAVNAALRSGESSADAAGHVAAGSSGDLRPRRGAATVRRARRRGIAARTFAAASTSVTLGGSLGGSGAIARKKRSDALAAAWAPVQPFVPPVTPTPAPAPIALALATLGAQTTLAPAPAPAPYALAQAPVAVPTPIAPGSVLSPPPVSLFMLTALTGASAATSVTADAATPIPAVSTSDRSDAALLSASVAAAAATAAEQPSESVNAGVVISSSSEASHGRAGKWRSRSNNKERARAPPVSPYGPTPSSRVGFRTGGSSSSSAAGGGDGSTCTGGTKSGDYSSPNHQSGKKSAVTIVATSNLPIAAFSAASASSPSSGSRTDGQTPSRVPTVPAQEPAQELGVPVPAAPVVPWLSLAARPPPPRPPRPPEHSLTLLLEDAQLSAAEAAAAEERQRLRHLLVPAYPAPLPPSRHLASASD